MNKQRCIVLIILLIAGLIFSIGMVGSLIENATAKPADELPDFIFTTRALIVAIWVVLGGFSFLIIISARKENQRLDSIITTLRSSEGIVDSLGKSLGRHIGKSETKGIPPELILGILHGKIPWCVESNNVEELQDILDGLTIDKEKDLTNAWLLAFKYRDTEAIMDLLWHKNYIVDVNLQGFKKRTAAHVAVMHGNYDYLNFLKDLEADFSIKDEEGKTPLGYLPKEIIGTLHNLLPQNILEQIYQIDSQPKPKEENIHSGENAK